MAEMTIKDRKVPMMKCGHAANAECDGKPCCVICIGLNPGAEIVDDMPDLSTRKAKCGYCGREAQSSTSLAFFSHRPGQPCDSYYCGCFGWD